MDKCRKSVTPHVNEDFNPVLLIKTSEVAEKVGEKVKTQKQINQELRDEITSLKKMITLLNRRIDEEL